MSDLGPVVRVGLLESLQRGQWLKLPLAVMRDVGPAVQTLAGLLTITSNETFVQVGKIASAARVPKRTTQKHLEALKGGGWIDSRGRERTRRGAPRRTCTWVITQKTKESLQA